MTVYAGLAIETGNKEDADKLADYFKNCQLEEQIRTFQDTEDNWWCHIYFECNNLETGNLNYLYEALKESNCSYRYALAGLEVDEFRTYSELIKELTTINIPGLVISTRHFVGRLNLPKWEYFSDGYAWQPYTLT